MGEESIVGSLFLLLCGPVRIREVILDCVKRQNIEKVGRHRVSFPEVVSLSLRESTPTVVLALVDLAIFYLSQHLCLL